MSSRRDFEVFFRDDTRPAVFVPAEDYLAFLEIVRTAEVQPQDPECLDAASRGDGDPHHLLVFRRGADTAELDGLVHLFVTRRRRR